ncbi:MAG: ATP-dependent endonuclease [Candidatus Gastranaerophilales bacterium]|nr:ATP-dependent endonuclease [Candidatus Gastranaerophilales bacterium]
MKYKKIPQEYFITILDRLTRFEPAFVRYKRVFDDIINKFSIDTKLKTLDLKDEISLAEEIFNSSIDNTIHDFIRPVLYGLEEKYFYSNEVSYQYLSARLNFTAMLEKIRFNENLPLNVKWLKKINEYSDLKKIREEKELLYPIEKVLLCEGETERILLSTILKKFNINLKKRGIILIPAGGKNQVARKYYSMTEHTKLPFFILLDNDADAIKAMIDAKIRANDEIYIIKSGEFEDLIPYNILEKTINYIHKNDQNCLTDDFLPERSNVLNIEYIYKKYGFGEFKKAHFAQGLKEYIEQNTSLTDFKSSEIIEIAQRLNF